MTESIAHRRRAMWATCLPSAYIIGCAALAAALAYPVFIATGGDSLAVFRKLVSRGGQIVLILGLFPIVRWLRLELAELGLHRALLKQFGVGLALGTLMLGLHTWGLLWLGVRAVNLGGAPELGRWLEILGKALLTGIGVALVEEMLFRGILFAMLRKYAGIVAAVLISALYYACLHFVGTKWTGTLAGLDWGTGFRMVAKAFAHVAEADPSSFLALWLAGVFLACVRTVFPSGLGYCMGIHAGWIFVIKTAKPLTHVMPDSGWSFLAGSYDHFIGYLSAVWIGASIPVVFAVGRYTPERKPVNAA